MTHKLIASIPEELKRLRQWINFDIVDGKKLPFVSGEDSSAASNRPTEWRSLEEALADVESGKRQHIGFAFATTDPFTFIDLDDLSDPDQLEILERIDSYSQRSVSGNGVHIICRGDFIGKGKHPKKPSAGIFKEARFCLWTGDVLPNRDQIRDIPTADLQSIHTWLGGGKDIATMPLVEYESDLPDMTVYQIGCDSFDRFEALSRGQWDQFDYPGHSEADHAFIAMLCEVSESNEQVRHLFKISGMWTEERQSKKAGHGENGYIDRTIVKIRSGQHRIEDTRRKLEALHDVYVPDEVEEEGERLGVGIDDMINNMPAGLMKEIARYSFSTSYYPLQEASVVVAISTLSLICGRGYLTPHNGGLNMWCLLLGPTGCGKDELQSGPKRLLSAISKTCPHAGRLFGGELVSDPGIETIFNEQLRYLAYFKEFGKTFSTMVGTHVQDHKKTLMGGLLNTYNLAQLSGSLEGRKKAKNDGEKRSIPRPALTIVGDSTPAGMYDHLSMAELESGFLQRFMLFNVGEQSWSFTRNTKNGAKPSVGLTDRLSLLAQEMDRFDAIENANPTKVEITPEADALLTEYMYQKRVLSSKSKSGGMGEIYNRAGMKVIRLASLAAVGKDHHNPVIEVHHLKWASEMIDRLDAELLQKFSSGDLGRGQVKQEAEVIKAFETIAAMSYGARRKAGMSPDVAKDRQLCPHGVLKARIVQSTAFADDRLGAVVAFDKCVDALVRSGKLMKYPKEAAEKYLTKGDLLYMP